MDARLTPYTLSEYCQSMDRGEITVNEHYQRSPKVWPQAAKSFLIETILLGFPMPKLSLHQITDVKTRKTRKEIVDGQQRSVTIRDFYANALRLSKDAVPTEAAECTYAELSEDLQHRFLDYALSVDLFIGATNEDIREVFRRMNSYTVPLNAEERRHSRFQGKFKWFIYRLTKRYSQAMEDMGAFSEKQLNRMQDAKLLSEVVYALVNGITTTKDAQLTKLYDDHEKEFADEVDVRKRVVKALDVAIELTSLHNGPLMKPHQLYAYLLALMHAQAKVPKLDAEYKFSAKFKLDKTVAVENLGRLAAAIDDPDSDRKLASFVEAGAEKTNVKDQRAARFRWYCKALANDMP
jgi:hypothetical protein